MNTILDFGVYFCAGFVLLVIASLLDRKITGGKILGGLKWLLSVPFGFVSNDTIKGLGVIRKEVDRKLIRECLETMLPGVLLGFLFMMGLKTAFGEYTLIDLIWKKPPLSSQYQSDTLVFNWMVLAVGLLCLLNWPRRFYWKERSFVKEAKAYEDDCSIFGLMLSGILCFIIFPPAVFIFAIDNTARRRYFLLIDDAEDQKKHLAFKKKKVFELTCWGIVLILGNIIIAIDLAMRLFF